jgi:hypothetical protein
MHWKCFLLFQNIVSIVKIPDRCVKVELESFRIDIITKCSDDENRKGRPKWPAKRSSQELHLEISRFALLRALLPTRFTAHTPHGGDMLGFTQFNTPTG